ncbi:MAG: YkgJ family cysteine cluster protein [Phycisphaerae bacterium]|nr:YkgJ family cysteine cluster protein [Phycisphaerae bacterium]
MRQQNLDTSIHFACQSCGACCDQSWRTMIEPEKARALDAHDFSAFPQLAGKTFYHPSRDPKDQRFELAKGEGTRCLFLDADNLCIIHKELGPEAKPHMCRQFPYLPACTWVDDRVSVNFGCPAVQAQAGAPLTTQAAEIRAIVPRSKRDPNPQGPVPLDAKVLLTQAEGNALFDRALRIFADAPAHNVWTSFGELLAVLAGVREFKLASSAGESAELIGLLERDRPLPGAPDVPAVHAYASPMEAPMPSRFLFASTLFPDTLPADASPSAGVLRRLALVPKLMALSRLSGGYASRLLGRNVSIHDVLRHPIAETLPHDAAELLLRYFRSRLWQRLPAGTRLPVIAGVHQHIQDLNAIIFFARAEAQHTGAAELTEPLIRQALTRVEFHLANQTRLYDNTLRRWQRAQLQNAVMAFQSLRLMSLQRTAQPAGRA